MDGVNEVLTVRIFELLISVFSAFLASSGFWLYYERKNKTRDCRDKLLIGLAHDRILYLGMKYIQRGWVTEDEYENLCEFLYTPYIDMGGNGTAKRVMGAVTSLPMRKSNMPLTEEVHK
jgi:hypothetical protein